MTRINLIPVEELHKKHLVAEAHEITRVFGLARKAQFDILKRRRKLPEHFTMGQGHVLFFYDKLAFISNRYEQLSDEMRRRGYKPNQIPREELLAGIDVRLHNDYVPTPEAIALSLERINLMMPKGD